MVINSKEKLVKNSKEKADNKLKIKKAGYKLKRHIGIQSWIQTNDQPSEKSGKNEELDQWNSEL